MLDDYQREIIWKFNVCEVCSLENNNLKVTVISLTLWIKSGKQKQSLQFQKTHLSSTVRNVATQIIRSMFIMCTASQLWDIDTTSIHQIEHGTSTSNSTNSGMWKGRALMKLWNRVHWVGLHYIWRTILYWHSCWPYYPIDHNHYWYQCHTCHGQWSCHPPHVNYHAKCTKNSQGSPQQEYLSDQKDTNYPNMLVFVYSNRWISDISNNDEEYSVRWFLDWPGLFPDSNGMLHNKINIISHYIKIVVNSVRHILYQAVNKDSE